MRRRRKKVNEKKEMNDKEGVVDLDSLNLSPQEKKFLLKLKQEVQVGIAS
jgi:hypothetical protein